MAQRYFDSTALIDRLCNASNSDRNVTFLVGSPISVPDYVGGHGVPGVSGMIDLIREEFEGTKAGAEFDQKMKGDLADQYRIAFEFLHGHRGQGAVNRTVRTAVWGSLATKNWPSDLPNAALEDADDATCSALEKAVDAWVLPRAVDTLGNLIASYPDTFGGTVLTTNFDPLIEEGLRIEIDIAMPQEPSSEPDRPLFVDDWVGREHELRLLASSNTPVAFITGIGGQGKSGLAGRFLQQYATKVEDRFETWDWRDCREESDRLSTLVLRIIERLSGGAIDESRIENTNIKALVGVLFRVLKDKRTLLVFDNVDQYIDLETFEPVKGLEVLVSEAQARSHDSLFLFTCRPDIAVDESRAVKLSLAGFIGGRN